ncbi:YggT family protein [Chitinibacteraceae bacterium HSL-7]
MLSEMLLFIVRSLGGFMILAFLARFFLQTSQTSFRTPVGQFVLALTNWAVLPVRRIIPPWRQYDTTSLLLAWLTALLMNAVLLMISPWVFALWNPLSAVALALVAVLEVAKMSLYLLLGAVIGQALMSWFAPYHPLMPMLNSLTGPFLRPLRRVIPPIGGVDITPIILLLVIQLILEVMLSRLTQLVLGLISVG